MTEQNFGIEDGKFDNSVVAYNANMNLAVDSAALQGLFKLIWERFEAELQNRSQSKASREVEWEEAAKEYIEKMADLYGTMRVLGMSEPVPLTGIYTDVKLLKNRTALRLYSREKLEEEFTKPSRRYRKEERRDGFEMALKKDKLFILGRPGAGKTTFLKYMVLQAVKGEIAKVPIFVSLKELADSGQKVLPFIVEQFAICNFPNARAFVLLLLSRGGALVLFDGLDEVQQEQEKRRQVIRELKKFTRQYDASQYLITCRIAATEYTFEKFTYVEMADFTPAQVKVFVGKWFHNDEPKRKSFLQELEKEQHKGLREMTENPLLLTLLCLTFEQTLHFPARRVEIYEEALEALLKKWDSSRNIRRDQIYRQLSLGRKRQMLAHIAYQTFAEGEYFIPQRRLGRLIESYLEGVPRSDVDEPIDGVAVLKTMEAQHGLFSERAQKIYSFSHLTFQEYFTTKYIVDNTADGTLERLIESHLGNDRWREVFLLTASLLDHAEYFFKLFIKPLNQSIASDKQLIGLVAWADKKAALASSIKIKVRARSEYIFLALIFGRGQGGALDRGLAQGQVKELARVLDLVQVLDLAQVLDLDLALGRARTLGQALDQALDRVQALDQALDRALDQAQSLDQANSEKLNLNLDFLLIFSWLVALTLSKVGALIEVDIKSSLFDKLAKVIQATQQMSQKLALVDLHHALQNLVMPEAKASEEEWQSFHYALLNILLTYREFKLDWQLSTEQYGRLADYLRATKLFVECIELAYVSNREEIENQVLLPPKTDWIGKLWVWLLVGLLIGGVLVGGVVIWMVS